MDTKENLADALTNFVTAVELRYHLANTGQLVVQGRHELAPESTDLNYVGSDFARNLDNINSRDYVLCSYAAHSSHNYRACNYTVDEDYNYARRNSLHSSDYSHSQLSSTVPAIRRWQLPFLSSGRVISATALNCTYSEAAQAKEECRINCSDYGRRCSRYYSLRQLSYPQPGWLKRKSTHQW